MIRDIAERQIVIDRRQISLTTKRRMRGQRLQLRPENDTAIGNRRIE